MSVNEYEKLTKSKLKIEVDTYNNEDKNE